MGEGSRKSLLPLLVLSAFPLLRISRILAADSIDHPYLESNEINSVTCLKCHPTKNQGKFVHSAIALGCSNCHQATSKDFRTTMALVATGGALCGKCHEPKTDPVQHGPFHAGECLICHNPHTGAYTAQTRASVNTLCSTCHMQNQPGVKVEAQTNVVLLLDDTTYGFDEYQRAPKISASHTLSNLPRATSGAATGKKAEKEAEKLNCLSCHVPHAGQAQHLLRSVGQSGSARVLVSGGGA